MRRSRWVFSLLAAGIAVAAIVAYGLRGRDAVAIRFDGPVAGWPHYGGDAGGRRDSPLTQIDRDNVGRLELAWTYRSGDVARHGEAPTRTSFQATPILFDGRLYLSTPFSRVVALDPESGRELWSHDPRIDRSLAYSEAFVSRGVAAWAEAEPASAEGPCGKRIFFGTLDARLLALDAATGRPCADFGDGGEVDLKRGVGTVEPGQYEVTSPPVVVGDVVVVGSAIGDNRRVEAERGTVRGFDARTGERIWAFDPIPRSEDDPAFAHWTPDDARRTGAANAWAPLSADPARGLVFVPTGSASPDFYGGARRGPGAHGTSLVALRAATGELVWEFQLVHHDLWDYDGASQPTLAALRVDGRAVPAVVQPTKMGFVFLLHRETGEPLFPVEERPVPQSDVPGETSSPTQPFPTRPPPLLPLRIDEDDAFGLTPWDRAACRDAIGSLRNEGIFTPPSLEGTLVFPSMIGGANWGGAAVDEARGVLVVNLNRVASSVRLVPRDDAETLRSLEGDVGLMEGAPYVMVREGILTSPLGIPCTKPPWGVLVAVDLDEGRVLWEVPLGTIRDLAPIPLPLAWGTPTLGGPIVTASGLVFIGATLDRAFRAFDVETGEILWETRLAAPAAATPMTYRLRPDGRQFVVVAAGGHARAPTDVADALVAFALPGPRPGPP